MTRSLTDIINDMRPVDHSLEAVDQRRARRAAVTRNEAADVLASLAKHLPQPPCDTCGGDQIIDSGDIMPRGMRCDDPNCDNGRLAWDVWLARVAVVWASVHADNGTRPATHLGGQHVIDFLRRLGRGWP